MNKPRVSFRCSPYEMPQTFCPGIKREEIGGGGTSVTPIFSKHKALMFALLGPVGDLEMILQPNGALIAWSTG